MNDPSYKGCLALPEDLLFVVWDMKIATLVQAQRYLKERLNVEVQGMVFPRNWKAIESFEIKLKQLYNGGLIDHYKQLLYTKHFTFSRGDGPERLTLEHLEAGFVTWIAAVCIAIIAFMFEWAVNLKEPFIFFNILRAYYEQKEVLVALKPRSKHLKLPETVKTTSPNLRMQQSSYSY